MTLYCQRKWSRVHSMGCVSSTSHTEQFFDKIPWSCLVFSHISIYPHQDEVLGTETMNMGERVGWLKCLSSLLGWVQQEPSIFDVCLQTWNKTYVFIPIGTFTHVYQYIYAITEQIINTKGHSAFNFYTYFYWVWFITVATLKVANGGTPPPKGLMCWIERLISSKALGIFAQVLRTSTFYTRGVCLNSPGKTQIGGQPERANQSSYQIIVKVGLYV